MAENTHSPRTVLVAGGERSPGAEVIRALAGAGHRIRAVLADAGALDGELRPLLAGLREVSWEEDPAPEGLFDGVDVLYSSLSLGGHPRWPTPWEIDGEANIALVRRAAAEGVGQVIFIAGTAGDQLRYTADIAAAREAVVDAIKPLGMRWTVLRPAGTFSGLHWPFRFCEHRGIWPVVGDGSTRFNPIHPADLAELVLRALDDEALQGRVIPVGGPEVLSLREMGELACEALGRRPRILPVPRGALSLAASGLRLYDANLARRLDRAGALSEREEVLGEPLGRRDLRGYFRELAAGGG